MDFGTIMEGVATYGAVPALIALVIFVIVMWIKSRSDSQKAEDEREKQRLEQQAAQEERFTKMLDTVVEKLSGTALHTKEEEDDNRRVNNFIEAQLSCLVQEEKANRSYVFMYHNGGKDMAGRSFQKMSITNEIVDPLTVPIMSNYQNVPRSMFPTLFKTLVAQDVYDIENIDDIEEADPVLCQMMKTHGVKTAFIHGVKRSDGMVLGFVVIEYVSNMCEDVAKAKANLEKKALKITGAMVGMEDYDAEVD